MEKWAFIVHPIDLRRDMAKKYPFAQFLPQPLLEKLVLKLTPKVVSHVTGVRSDTGVEAEGWFVGCPLSPRQFLELDQAFVYQKIIRAGRIAEDLGAKIVGLGAYTSVVGDAGLTIKENLDIAVTTGNSYTVATAMAGLFEAGRLMGVAIPEARAAVVGATGSIGRVCAQILAEQVGRVTLVGRDLSRLAAVREEISQGPGLVDETTDINEGLRQSDLVVTVSSAVDALIYPEHLKSGAVVCDVARPRDVSRQVVEARNDVLVIEGGVVSVPGDVEFNFDFGFPPKTAYACMSETMILALEGTYESFTLGRDITLDQVKRIALLASKHGFKLAGFRSFERAVTPDHIETIRRNIRPEPHRSTTRVLSPA